MARGIGWGALGYWVVFWIFVYGDFYLSRPVAATALKLFFPVACLMNLYGLVTALSLWSVRRREAAGLLLLHAPPLAAVAYGIWWLFFGVKI
ncbi:MAG: hypothetical protein KA248_00460 [Kiritimatiellae bacterium]|nr:hypothetical protein [Kiritimatiellia bacterium]